MLVLTVNNICLKCQDRRWSTSSLQTGSPVGGWNAA